MRRLLGLLATLAIIAATAVGLGWAPGTARAAEFGADWQPVKRQIDDGKYYLQSDVTFTRPMQVFGRLFITMRGRHLAHNSR